MDKEIEKIIFNAVKIYFNNGDWKTYLEEMINKRNERGEKSGSKL